MPHGISLLPAQAEVAMIGLTRVQIAALAFALLLGLLAGSAFPMPTGQEHAIAPFPHDARELIDKLRDENLHLYYVDDWSNHTAYFMEDPRPIRELLDLPSTLPKHFADWKGTVRVFNVKPSGSVLDTAARDRGGELRRWIRTPGTALFSRGSILFQKGLPHVACIFASTLDDGVACSVAAP
jgi:hypothetical protein